MPQTVLHLLAAIGAANVALIALAALWCGFVWLLDRPSSSAARSRPPRQRRLVLPRRAGEASAFAGVESASRRSSARTVAFPLPDASRGYLWATNNECTERTEPSDPHHHAS